MSAPTYVIGFLLILTGLIGFITQTPYLSIYPSGKFENGLEMTLAAEDAPTLKFEYYSLGSHNDKEQAEALAKEIMAQGNSGEHQGWYAIASGDEKSPKLQIFRKDGLSLSVNDWSRIKDGSGAQPKGTMSFGKSPTALIPALFGLIIIGCVIGSQRKEDLRKLLMHIAAGIGLLGTIVPGKMAWSSYNALDKVKETLGELPFLNANTQPPSPGKFLSQGVTAALCFFFLILCIQSFVKARKKQAAAKVVARPPLDDPQKPKSTREDKKPDSDKEEDDKEEDKLPSMKKKLGHDEKKQNEDSQKSKGQSSNKPLASLSSDKKKVDLKSPQSPSAKKSPDKPSLSKSIAGKPPVNAPSDAKKPKDDKTESKGKSGSPTPSGPKDGGPMPLPPRSKVTPSKTLLSSDNKADTENKPEGDKKDPIQKSGPPASEKKDRGPLPPPSSGETPDKTVPSSDKNADAKNKPEGDKRDPVKKSGPPPPSEKKERGPMPPPPKESPGNPPPPPGSPPSPKSNLTDSASASPKASSSDQKGGKFRLSGNKPLRINRPKNTPSSADKKEDDANE
ncbi:MAG: hypothetical protein CMI31_03670 [Opitutae bacterium]|nr:hypothetical protein [Opitutae bacterium]